MDQLKPAIISFAAKRDLIDDKRIGQAWKVASQSVRKCRELIIRQSAGQGQMKAEFFHDIGVTPLHEKHLLQLRQSSFPTAFKFDRACGCPESIQFAYTNFGNSAQARNIARRRQGQKAAQRRQLQTAADARRKRRGKTLRSLFQLSERHPLCQPERRFQSPVKPIFHRCHGDVTQTGHIRLIRLTAQSNIPAQPRCAKLRQGSIGRQVIDRKARV